MREDPELVPTPDIVHRRIENETVLLHLPTNRIFSLNETATRFWELLVAGNDTQAIKRALTAEFEVSEDQLDGEIETIVASLLSEGLLTREPASS